MLKFSDLSRAGFPFMTEPLGIMKLPLCMAEGWK